MPTLKQFKNILPIPSLILFSISTILIQVSVKLDCDNDNNPLIKEILLLVSQFLYMVSYLLSIREKEKKHNRLHDNFSDQSIDFKPNIMISEPTSPTAQAASQAVSQIPNENYRPEYKQTVVHSNTPTKADETKEKLPLTVQTTPYNSSSYIPPMNLPSRLYNSEPVYNQPIHLATQNI